MKLKHLILSLLAMVCFSACSDDDDPQTAINHVRLSTTSATTLSEDTQDSVKVNVLLGHTSQKDITLTFKLEGNEGEVLAINTPSLTFKAGEKSKDIFVYSNQKSTLSSPRVITLNIANFSEPKMDQFGEGITLTVNPDADIPVLDDAQKELLKGYRDNLGMDVERMMGKLSCKVKVIFPKEEVGEEGETIFSKDEILEYNTESILTLSEKATAEQPVLKMVGNAMGLTSIFHKILNKEISINNQVGTSFPSVAEAVQYDEKNETFTMSLDNITLKEDGSLNFVDGVADVYGDTIQGVPFRYDFSAWERQSEMAKAGKTIDIVVKNSETGEVEYTENEVPMSTAIETGLTFSPYTHLIASDINEDSWETGIWKAPASQVDFNAGIMKFSFPWDHVYSSDWTLIEVTYHLHSAK